MSALIRIYSNLGKENVYSFTGYNTLNNQLTVYSNIGIQDVSILNLRRTVESNEPCTIVITDSSNDIYTTTTCTINGARLDKESNAIVFESSDTSFTRT